MSLYDAFVQDEKNRKYLALEEERRRKELLDNKANREQNDDTLRKEALKNIVCTNIYMGELVDKNKNYFDIVQLMDCSILPWGYMIGWHYGVSFDIDDEENRKVIENFKKEVFE